MLRALCSETFRFKPWEVGRLTPFQVYQCLLVEQEKDGTPKLDPPMSDEVEVFSLEAEFRTHYLTNGITDPDVIRKLTAMGVAAIKAENETIKATGEDE